MTANPQNVAKYFTAHALINYLLLITVQILKRVHMWHITSVRRQGVFITETEARQGKLN